MNDSGARLGFGGLLGARPGVQLPGVLPNPRPRAVAQTKLVPIPEACACSSPARGTTRGKPVWVFEGHGPDRDRRPADEGPQFNLIGGAE